jgi:vancomycin resistance protein YoaR
MVFLFVVGLVWFVVSYDGKIYRGVSAVGIDISGFTKAEAETQLENWLAECENQPFALRYAEFEQYRTLGEMGLQPDTAAIAAAAYDVGRAGFSFESLREILGSAFGGHRIAGSPFINQTLLNEKIHALADKLDREPQDGSLSLARGTVTTKPPIPGRSLNQAATMNQLLAMLDSGRLSTIALPVVDNIRPDIDENQLDAAVAQANSILEQPLVLSYDTRRWEYAAPDVAELLLTEKTVANGHPALVIKADEKTITDLVQQIAKQVNQTSVEAQWRFNGTAVEVTRASQIGLQVDITDTSDKIAKTLIEAESKQTTLTVEKTYPKLSTETIKNWRINGLVANAQTNYFSGKERMHNIETAAVKITGFLIPQGEVFSLNDALGTVSTATGYQQAYIILNGETVPGMGGGLCQVATTLFQAVFWGGYTITERYPHDYHMPRYESTMNGVTYKGLDATIDSGVDFKFLNDGPSALYLQVSTDGQNFSVNLFGSKPDWKVDIGAYNLTNIRPTGNQKIVRQSAEVPVGQEVQVEKATDGFDSAITRIVTTTEGGRESYTVYSSYRPTQDVFLVGTGPARATP